MESCNAKLFTCHASLRETMEDLWACLDCTDWDMFTTAINSLDEPTEAVTSYITFCENCCIPTHTRIRYNNDKPWLTAKLRRLMLDKEEVFRSGDRQIQGVEEQV